MAATAEGDVAEALSGEREASAACYTSSENMLMELERTLNPTVRSYIKERTARKFLRKHLRSGFGQGGGRAQEEIMSVEEVRDCFADVQERTLLEVRVFDNFLPHFRHRRRSR